MSQNKSAKIYYDKIITVCNAVYFRLCIDLMHILPPVTAEGFDGSHHPRFAEWLEYMIRTVSITCVGELYCPGTVLSGNCIVGELYFFCHLERSSCLFIIVTLKGTYDWLIVWCLMPFSTVFQLYRGRQCTYPCFPGVLLTSVPHIILSKPLAAFPHDHCRNNGKRWERNYSCRNDSSILRKNIGRARARTRTSCSQVRNATDWAMGFGGTLWELRKVSTLVSMCSLRRLTRVEIFRYFRRFSAY